MNKEGHNITDILRGKIMMLSEVMAMKDSFVRVNELKDQIDKQKKNIV
jgi:hypothetical protein